MKKTRCFYTFLLLMSIIVTSAFAQDKTTPVARHGQLSVKAGKIIDKNGLPPELRGISFSWSIWGGKKYYNPAVVDWLASDFKVSLIRASMAVQPDSGYLQRPKEQTKLVATVVDRAIKNSVYVLIDWHDHNAQLHLKESKAFFSMMARKYKGVPNVIYEVWNEPERQSWDTVKMYAVEVIKEIRKYDTKNLIVVGSTHWDQDVDVAASNPIIGFNNIAYSFHFYASEPSHQDGLRAKAETAMQKGLALIVTEWGVGEASGDGVFDPEKTDKWVAWLNKNKLSWANWNITDKKETTALLLPGAAVNGGWNDNSLTPAGQYIRTELRKLNAGLSK